jgi:type II secretory pathway pseudopilin PulG
MIVVVIIGILISIVAVSGGTARARARDVRRKEDLRQIQSGVETYFQATRQYPSMHDGWKAEDGLSALVPQFLITVPDDPRPQSDTVSRFYAYQATDGTNNVIAPSSGASRYRLLAALELEGDVDQPVVLCSFLVSTSQNPPFCGEVEMTLIQTGGALWNNALWGEKSF